MQGASFNCLPCEFVSYCPCPCVFALLSESLLKVGLDLPHDFVGIVRVVFGEILDIIWAFDLLP